MDNQLEKATRQHTKDHNSRLLLRTIYEYGEISRANLARLTSLTRATVSDVVAELIERGLVEEVGHGATSVGRTPVLLSVVEEARQVAAISLTNESVAGALMSLRGALREQVTLPLPRRDGETALATVYAVADRLVAAAARPLLGIGINTPGLIDTSSGTVVRGVSFGWEELPLGALLQARYGLPAYVSNDSHSLALAEYMFGPAQGTPNLVVVKLGNGIGAGIILGGHLYTGEGYGAGEIGHLVVDADGPPCKCGNSGCLETVASAGAILGQARARGYARPDSLLRRFAPNPAGLTLDHIAVAASRGDATALAVIAAAGRSLGIALAGLVSVLNVRRVLLTGRVAALGPPLGEQVRAELSRRALPALVRQTSVEVAQLGADAPLLGAAAPLLTYELGLERLTRRPALA
ncbi:MAG TPA: ROK family transcriptional regulator [Chloroflexaceae bacterium]|nr:ROK family transcriptional regulator [Chloroflexaceae bacterium]